MSVENRKFISLQAKPSPPPIKPFSDEWFVLKFLEGWTADDLRLAIEKDMDLEELILKHPEEAKPIRLIAEGYDPSGWSLGDILYWFSVRRPDLYKVIVESERGVEWVKKHWMKRMKIKETLSNI